ncbi:T9SS type A sorting domain-containing protein [candidate division KSB1 bacterium]|nr:T9SS type A sorting domain-containing protein [candidate division KSB1 bacterium]
MKSYQFLVLVSIFLVLQSGVSYSQESLTAVFERYSTSESVESSPLNPFVPGQIYACAGGNGEPLQVMPGHTTPPGSFKPFRLESRTGAWLEASSVLQGDFQPPDLTHTPATLYYSALFAPLQVTSYWGFNYDFAAFRDQLTQKTTDGFRIESIKIYSNAGGSENYFAATWCKDDQGYAYVVNYKFEDFVAKLNELTPKGFRILNIEFNDLTRQYTGVWIQDSKSDYWILNYTLENFWQVAEQQKGLGRRPCDLSIYANATNSGFLCSAAWIQNSENYDWGVAIYDSWSSFDSLLQTYNAGNFRMLDFDRYQLSNVSLWAGIWVKDSWVGSYSINYTDVDQFVDRINYWQTNYNLRPIKFEMIQYYSDAVPVEKPNLATNYELSQNYPNPFNPATTITFQLPADAWVQLTVFDVTGQEIARLLSQKCLAGHNEVVFQAGNLPSGIYFYRLEARGPQPILLTRKMTLIK